MKNGTFRVICAGQKDRLFEKESGDFVAAADGGLLYADRAGIKVDLVVGDFDSLGYIPKGENVLRLPTEKDDTDALFAVKKGVEAGFSEFALYCALGGEADHSIANLQILLMLVKSGKHGYIVSDKRVVTACCGERIIFSPSCKGKFSVFSAEDIANVSISGAKYDFCGELKNTFPVGASNEFMGKQVQICAYKPVFAVFGTDIYERKSFKREREEEKYGC